MKINERKQRKFGSVILPKKKVFKNSLLMVYFYPFPLHSSYKPDLYKTMTGTRANSTYRSILPLAVFGILSVNTIPPRSCL
mmetsp:Transcript_9416/g.12299  ORF Transcript_9416/g.12299 Transcript_9416/m.12299 type:complete len:81 (+) Transcript_9416:1045-1287(+)